MVAGEAATVVEIVVDEAVIEISRRMTFLLQKKRSRFPLRMTDQVSEDLQASAPGFPWSVFIAASLLARLGPMGIQRSPQSAGATLLLRNVLRFSVSQTSLLC